MSNTYEVIREVYNCGGKLMLEGDSLRVSAPEPLPENLRQALREQKPSIMVALGAPLDVVVAGILKEIRPHLPEALRELSDEKILALVNWSIIAAWERTAANLIDDGLKGRS